MHGDFCAVRFSFTLIHFPFLFRGHQTALWLSQKWHINSLLINEYLKKCPRVCIIDTKFHINEYPGRIERNTESFEMVHIPSHSIEESIFMECQTIHKIVYTLMNWFGYMSLSSFVYQFLSDFLKSYANRSLWMKAWVSFFYSIFILLHIEMNDKRLKWLFFILLLRPRFSSISLLQDCQFETTLKPAFSETISMNENLINLEKKKRRRKRKHANTT